MNLDGAPTAVVLFTGYAPVHFACFEPLLRALADDPNTHVVLSGGVRRPGGNGAWEYDTVAMYEGFDTAGAEVVGVDQLGSLDVDLHVVANTKAIKPHSARSTLEIFHGMSFRNRAVRSAAIGKDHYFVLGPYMMRQFLASGIFPPGDPRLVPVGFMKTDPLLDPAFDRDALLASWNFDPDLPTVVYAPTGARFNSLETVGPQLLTSLAASRRFNVWVKPHDHPKNQLDWVNRLSPYETPHLRTWRGGDIIPALRAADALVTDASSTAFEFALRDRPIVFVDVPELLARARAGNSLLDLKTWGRRFGDVVADATDVPAALRFALDHPHRHSHLRRRLVEDLFYNPGSATEAAVRWLGDGLGIGPIAASAVARS